MQPKYNNNNDNNDNNNNNNNNNNNEKIVKNIKVKSHLENKKSVNLNDLSFLKEFMDSKTIESIFLDSQ